MLQCGHSTRPSNILIRTCPARMQMVWTSLRVKYTWHVYVIALFFCTHFYSVLDSSPARFWISVTGTANASGLASVGRVLWGLVLGSPVLTQVAADCQQCLYLNLSCLYLTPSRLYLTPSRVYKVHLKWAGPLLCIRVARKAGGCARAAREVLNANTRRHSSTPLPFSSQAHANSKLLSQPTRISNSRCPPESWTTS